jgi:hypothetical protein
MVMTAPVAFFLLYHMRAVLVNVTTNEQSKRFQLKENIEAHYPGFLGRVAQQEKEGQEPRSNPVVLKAAADAVTTAQEEQAVVQWHLWRVYCKVHVREEDGLWDVSFVDENVYDKGPLANAKQVLLAK